MIQTRARPLPGTVELLGHLAARFAAVALLSGRPADYLAKHAAAPGARYFGLYGLQEIRDGHVWVDPRRAAARPAVMAAQQDLRDCVATTIQLVFMLAAMGFGAAAFHGWFRLYSIASLVTSVVACVASFMAAPYAPTPILGIGERISIAAFLLWTAVLAIALWGAPVDAANPQH